MISLRRPGRDDLLPFQIVMGVTAGSLVAIIALLGDLRDELHLGNTGIGVMVASGFLAAFAAQVTMARFADRGYGRQMAAAGIALSSASLMVMVFADGTSAWAVSRAVLGFAVGLTMPAVRRAASVFDPDNVGENMGRMVVGETIGFIFGPAVAAVLAHFGGVRLPFAVFAAAMAAFLPFALRLPPDRGRLDESRRGVVSWNLLGQRRLQGALMFVGGYFVMIGAWEAVIPVMFADRGGGALVTGLAFTLLALPLALVSRLAGRTADRLGPVRVCVASMTVVALVTTTYGVLPGLAVPVAVMGALGFVDGFGFVSMQVVVCRAVVEQRQAAALGLMGASEVLGAGLAALPSSLLYDRAGAKLTWPIVGVAMLVIVGLGRLRIIGTHPVSSLRSSQAASPHAGR